MAVTAARLACLPATGMDYYDDTLAAGASLYGPLSLWTEVLTTQDSPDCFSDDLTVIRLSPRRNYIPHQGAPPRARLAPRSVGCKGLLFAEPRCPARSAGGGVRVTRSAGLRTLTTAERAS
jgi:hypothetical protein